MIRVIPRLDIKGDKLIKSINFEGVRVVGNPSDFAQQYYENGADEIILMDSVASLYGRNNLDEIISNITKNIFIPITVGGGIRTLDDAQRILSRGADKVAVNTAAVETPNLISEIVSKFGSQAFVLSIEAKYHETGWWEAYINGGRDKTGINVLDWISNASKRGIGEILLTSIDNEGTGRGFDIPLYVEASRISKVPIIASGGFGSIEHMFELSNCDGVYGIAIADRLHYKKISINEIKKSALEKNIDVRLF
ncbi:imidazole glycerol phosphate synthase subunit HisF [Polynucleobacter sp.]|uniref:imidazole glycerol phosphate synthase subunit HisF n=1 Tax=Polynucleobacter sp. TaxID=2029855 RepID=UPI003F69A051